MIDDLVLSVGIVAVAVVIVAVGVGSGLLLYALVSRLTRGRP